jgi:hypothetical protein
MSKLVNAQNVRAYALSAASRLRPHVGFERVSKHFVDRIDARLRNLIDSEVRSLPSKGVTIK